MALDKPAECGKCGKRFTSIMEILAHIRKAHKSYDGQISAIFHSPKSLHGDPPPTPKRAPVRDAVTTKRRPAATR